MGEPLHEIQIAIEEIIAAQSLSIFPLDLLERAGLRLACVVHNLEEDQEDRRALQDPVFVPDNFGADLRLYAKFFLKLAGQRFHGSFAALDFSSGKLPLERVPVVALALADEQFAVGALDHGGGNNDRALYHKRASAII